MFQVGNQCSFLITDVASAHVFHFNSYEVVSQQIMLYFQYSQYSQYTQYSLESRGNCTVDRGSCAVYALLFLKVNHSFCVLLS